MKMGKSDSKIGETIMAMGIRRRNGIPINFEKIEERRAALRHGRYLPHIRSGR